MSTPWIAGALALPLTLAAAADAPPPEWLPDRGDGSYRNPVLAGDYSDPDVVRVGDDFYLTASSFANVPGLPILHSRDLVNWRLIGHALPRLSPDAHFATPRRGGGVWAPAIRYRGGRFVIYYPDPDHGIFLVTARDPAGPWSAPVLVDDTKGAIDPAPFWDADGRAWLVHGYAASRAGFGNVITLRALSRDGTRVTGAPRTIIDGARLSPVRTSRGTMPWFTIEGPKLYRRAGYYYLFAPAGSVKGGWQGVFRARRIEGPYEARDVLDQGTTAINGPHQGALVDSAGGADWFVHFQDKDSYGRVVHLQPVAWHAGWPVIGADPDGDGIGEPVLRHALPLSRSPTRGAARSAPPASDDFDAAPSLAWQWNANPAANWIMPAPPGLLRLNAVSSPANLYEAGHLLSQKLPAERFTVSARMRLAARQPGERAGLALFGTRYAWIGLARDERGVRVVRATRLAADRGGEEAIDAGPPLAAPDAWVWLRFTAEPVERAVPPPAFPHFAELLRERHILARFSYSLDGRRFVPLGGAFESRPGRWVGAQVGVFAQAPSGTPSFTANQPGHADIDMVRFTP